MKIAVIGAGVSGLVAARRLTRAGHDVSVFEAGGRWGGHAWAVSVDGVEAPVEVGFLVFNQAVCPGLARLLAELDVPARAVRVSYEVRRPESKLVVRGGSLRELLSIPRNLAIPAFYRVVPDWMRFTRQARQLLQRRRPVTTTLDEFLRSGRYSAAFADQFAYPLAGAVYPVPRPQLAETPLASLLALLENHSLLNLTPTDCRVLSGGSGDYLQRLTGGFRERIHLDCPVAAIARNDEYVLLKFPHRSRERFDRVVLAVHADTALRLLADPTRHERAVLECFEYAPQNVHLHREDALQGQQAAHRPDASATWRFQLSDRGATLSYRVARFQDVNVSQDLMLTVLGAEQPPPPRVLRSIGFRRPVFSSASVLAQCRFDLINGRRRTYFCGSYWGHGFHEDAVRSGEQAAELLSRDASRELAGV